jgi:N6-L-threonylcarbamoyladenine synthase
MSNEKYILGIETSCDDTSICILKEGKDLPEVLAHKSFGQEVILQEWGGVVPEIAARNHLQKLVPLMKFCFDQAKLKPKDIDLIGVTTKPGLLGPLLTGLNAAKTLSLLHETPIVPVNHLYAHLEAIQLTQNVSYPYLGLLLSGGHSIFFWVTGKDEFKVLGSTIDDAAGEAFDKGGKLLELGYPAGRIIDELSQWGNLKAHEFPIGLKSSADARFSFSGLKTALRLYLENNPEILQLRPKQLAEKEEASQKFYDICAAYQDAIVRAILLKSKYAIKQVKELGFDKFPIVVGGGVACNSAIRKALTDKYQKVHFVEPKFCTDNGAMIANFARLNPGLAVNYPKTLELDARSRFIDKKEFNK